MTDDGHPDDLVGAYVIEACSPEEARLVAEHASHCPTCAAEIARLSRVAEWVGVATTRAPAPELRSRVLSAALAARPVGRSAARPSPATADDAVCDDDIRRLVEPYQIHVGALDQLLSGMSETQWLVPAGPHRSARSLMVHLRDNDELVAAVAGVRPSTVGSRGTDVRLEWRTQAGAIINTVARRGHWLLDREVRLAGRTAIQRPLREALIQRGFETWIHAEDVRAALHLPPQTPSAGQLADIVDFALRLIPAAMDAAGRGHPSQAIQLVLTGGGGGTRQVDLSATSRSAATVVAEISLPAERFCRLLAGRLTAPSTSVEIDGDASAAQDFLTVAATMGCD